MVIVSGGAAAEREELALVSAVEAAKKKKEEKVETYRMDMLSERSRSLHNFSLPRPRWGRQKQLRCVKIAGGKEQRRSPSDGGSSDERKRRSPSDGGYGSAGGSYDDERKRQSASDGGYGDQRKQRSPSYGGYGGDERKRRSPSNGGYGATSGGYGGIEEVRERLMIDLRTEMDQMKFQIWSEGGAGTGDYNNNSGGAPAETRPWNLRTRRAVCKEPNGDSGGGSGVGKSVKVYDRKPRPSPAIGVSGEGPRAKFSVSLSKVEIEEDFMKIMGIRPARRPKKRAKYVQKQLDALFPGLWLSEITADMYKVNENPDAGKR